VLATSNRAEVEEQHRKVVEELLDNNVMEVLDPPLLQALKGEKE
ncbi:hypothetical protein LCGC14_2089460, partial [marine sediment metagenome]